MNVLKTTSLLIVFLFMVGLRATGQQTGCGLQTRISLSGSSETQVQLCGSDSNPSFLSFKASSLSLPYVVLVTDESGIIQTVSYQISINFDQYPPGRYRVYILSFLGSLRAKPGMNAFQDNLAKVCHGLSANYISVSTLPPAGGLLSFADGSDSSAICAGDGLPDILQFKTSSSDFRFLYLITDDQDVILDVASQPSYNFDGSTGVRHIWGVSLTGSLPQVIGLRVQDANLNGTCSKVSDNYLTAFPATPKGGQVRFGNGISSIRQCSSDPRNTMLPLETTSDAKMSYAFFLSDETDQFVRWISGNTLNVPALPVGRYRLRGISYTGNLNTQVTGNIASARLGDNCFELSTNFLEVEVYAIDPGTITTADQRTEVRLCLNDQVADRLSFKIPSSSAGYTSALIVTDDKNIVLGIFPSDASIDFAVLPGSVNRVYGTRYEGTLDLQPGMSISAGSVSGGCFAITPAFVVVTKDNPDGGIVRFSDGASTKSLCFIDNNNPGPISVLTTGQGGAYRYLLTTAEGVVLAISATGNFDLGGFASGSYRVYGLSFTGSLTAVAGARIQDVASFSDGCTDLSSNSLSLDRVELNGGSIALAGGSREIAFCSDGSQGDVLNVVPPAGINPRYGYILTDVDGIVVRTYLTNRVELDKSDSGAFQLWGVAFSGTLTVKAGDPLDATMLSSACFDLSTDYITVSRGVVNGGSIVDDSGDTQFVGCVDPGSESTLYVGFNREAIGDYAAYILTDASNKVLLIQEESFFSFEGFLPGNFRIWHLAYTGSLLLNPGQKVTDSNLSTDCYDLSDTFIAVSLERPDGGMVRLSTGATEFNLCLGEGSGFVSFRNSSTASSTYQYVLTNERDEVILVLVGANFDISVAPAGSYRVYGVSYTGKLALKSGMNMRTAMASDRCYSVSRNYVTLRNELVRGGEIAFSDDILSISKYICPEDQGNRPIRFLRIGTQAPGYALLATNGGGTIVAVSKSDSLSLAGLPEGDYQIWGLAYSGVLYAAPGTNPATSPLAQRCSSLSENFLTINWSSPLGGTVKLDDGAVSRAFCPGGPLIQRAEVVSEDALGGTSTFILVDSTDQIVHVADSGVFYLDTLPSGQYQVWGLTYNGALLAKPGVRLGAADLATTCFALSTNAIALNKEKPVSGVLELVTTGLSNGAVCSGGTGSGAKQLVVRSVQSSQTPYVFLATDTLNKLVYTFVEGNVPDTATYREVTIQLDSLRGGNYKFWGLAYTGALNLTPGMRVDSAVLSNDCFALSGSKPFSLQSADGGKVVPNGFNGDTLYICIGDNKQDSVFFSNTSMGAGGGYRYVLTNPSNVVLAELTGNVMNFENAGFRELRLWGISFTGNYTSVRNKNLLTAIPSDGCYELSDNYITIFRDVPSGGTISIGGSTADLQFCPGRDGSTVQLRTSSTSRSGYVFILADASGIIRGLSGNGTFDLKAQAIGAYRVHGLSYTGNLLFKVGDTLRLERALSSSCYQLANNFIRINRGAEVNGQSVSTLFGETTVSTCPGDGVVDLIIVSTPQAGVESTYQLMLTNAQNRIIFPNLPNTLIDFEDIDPGVYRIWGVSYGGTFLGQFNTVVGVENLSTGCFDLSDNYITVIAETPLGGTVFAGDNQTSLDISRTDARRDIYRFSKNGASVNAPYVFLVTTPNNEVLSVHAKDSIDLDMLPAGDYRVWGLAYTGTLLASPGSIAGVSPMSDNCFALSSNFVAVKVRSTANGSNIHVTAPDYVQEIPGQWLRLQVAPNPIVDYATARFVHDGVEEASMLLEVFTLNGTRVASRRIQAIPGQNEIELELGQQHAGVYMLRLSGKKGSETVRLIKL